MDPDLYLRTYLQRDRELVRRLEHRRVARERAASSPGGAGTNAPAGERRASVRTPIQVVATWADRARHAMRRASTSAPCCAPA